MTKEISNAIDVSDLAVLRYLQRHKGIDIEAIRRHIGSLCQTGAKLNAISVKVEGLRFILDGKRVVTVVHRRRLPYIISQHADMHHDQ